tara:strand:+ start:122 stop:421 length:300 start_codon:yes stop_codon:yes gene_type:complete
MKITKRQLKRIIKEERAKLLREATMMGRAPMGALPSQKMYQAITKVLSRSPGMEASELVDTVNQMHPGLDAEAIYDFIDELEADGEIMYDESMDAWSLA